MIQGPDIKALLKAGEIIDSSLPGGGHIHIERPQPFICIYRKTKSDIDVGTEELVTAQATYLVFPPETADQDTAHEALEAALDALAEMFGAVLVLELFAMPLPDDFEPEEGAPRPEFEILAARHGAPTRTLEALEEGLLEQPWPGGEPAIRVAYKQHRGPEGLPTLLTSRLRKREDVTDIVIGVRAIYRDHASNAVLPLVLRETRRSLTTALRQGFYVFSHTRADHRPAHYHELGQQAIDNAVRTVDRGLAKVGDSFDLILDSTPVNNNAAWLQFRASRYEKAPEFHYRPLLHDPGTLKRQLYGVPLEKVEDPALHALFVEKRQELDNQIDLLADRDTKRFLYGSLQVYGAPDDPQIELAKKIVEAIPPRAREKGSAEVLDARAFAQIAQEELEHYRGQCPELKARVEIRDDVAGLLVSNGHFLVSSNAKVSVSRAPAAIAHEIGTHILTYYNGLAQPFQQLHLGMAGYEALQEGMAVLAEYLVGGLSRPRLRLLAGRVLAVAALIDGAGFVETARMLHDDHGFGRRGAYTIAMRVHRSGGLTKDLVYLKGLDDLLKHLGETDMPFEDLLVGKFALNHLPLVEELRWRKILKGPMLLPRYLSDKSAQMRLEKLRKGLGPLDLIKGSAQ
jgi:uncharacterized protein (TIGR02421 family)